MPVPKVTVQQLQAGRAEVGVLRALAIQRGEIDGAAGFHVVGCDCDTTGRRGVARAVFQLVQAAQVAEDRVPERRGVQRVAAIGDHFHALDYLARRFRANGGRGGGDLQRAVEAQVQRLVVVAARQIEGGRTARRHGDEADSSLDAELRAHASVPFLSCENRPAPITG
jgi:hypothetical protein